MQSGKKICRHLPPFPAVGTGCHHFIFLLFKPELPHRFQRGCWAQVLGNRRELVFEFVRPPIYHPPQVKFPRHQPLGYLDRQRDTKEPMYGIS
ncbi:hypothetical protein Q9966_013543 [Columba livia]|nr:hypothetical protein Q9966_013543 [Columba livia]